MKLIRLATITAAICLALVKPVKANEIHTAIATAYCTSGTTATGTQTTEGRTVAAQPKYYGSTIVIWLNDGDNQIKPENYIGTYIVEDTGAKPIRIDGTVIDIYLTDYWRCKEWGAKKVIYQIIKAEG